MSGNCTITCPCDNDVCLNTCSTLKRITRRVRMPMSLFVSRQSAFSIGSLAAGGDTFSGPSDRNVRAVNPITGKVGVDKKKNSYARYLGRLKGPVLRKNAAFAANIVTNGCGNTCCCYCSQTIKSKDTGTGVFHLLQVGDTVVQATTGATGTIIWVGSGLGDGGDEDHFIASVKDCENNPFVDSGSGTHPYSFFRNGVLVGTQLDQITIQGGTSIPCLKSA